MSFALTILGAPRTKKTSNRIVRCGNFPKVLPSKAHEQWFKQALPQARIALPRIAREWPTLIPVAHPVNCNATVFRQTAVGDAIGYYQAIADLLQRSGILRDDRFIVSWDGSTMQKDSLSPRIEIEIYTAPGAEPQERLSFAQTQEITV